MSFFRTAAAMAAFVGNHACVAVINNFIPKEDVWYFTRYGQSFKGSWS
jgi:hypothetical protein